MVCIAYAYQGASRLWGTAQGNLGAALVVFLEYFASLYTPERWPLILGGAFLVSVTFLKGGAALHLTRLWERLKKGHGIA